MTVFLLLVLAPAYAQLPAWGLVDTPNNGTRDNSLLDVSAVSADDIWTVGEWNPGIVPTETGRRTLTQHWDGSTWSIIPSPDPAWSGLDYASLNGVAAVASDDVWAVGYAEDFASLKSTTLIEHWDGGAWSIVPSPNPGGSSRPNKLYDVATVAANDAWAVGEAGYPQRALILRYDGSAWTSTPNRCGVPLRSIAMVSATEGWTLGGSTTCRFRGGQWGRVRSPEPRPAYSEVAYAWQDVAAVDSNDVWAVGYRTITYFEGYLYSAIAMHWDGSGWTLDANIPGQAMNSVVALAADDVWAVGTDGANPLVVHWDGSTWSSVPTPSAGQGGPLQAVDALGPDNLWAAGFYYSGDANNDEQTLVMNAPSATSGGVVGDTGVAYATVTWIGPQNGSTETNAFGDYAAAGLLAGDYTFVASTGGCSPAVANVTVVAGQVITQDLPIGC